MSKFVDVAIAEDGEPEAVDPPQYVVRDSETGEAVRTGSGRLYYVSSFECAEFVASSLNRKDAR